MEKDKIVRKAQRASLTKLFTKLEAADHTEVDNVYVIIEDMRVMYKKIDNLTDKIIDELNTEVDIMAEVEHQEKYTSMLSKAETIFRKLSQTKGDAKPHNAASARLPKLELPRFSGDYLEWQTFDEMFTCSVDNNLNLSNIEKFSYLKASLKGDAAKCIEGLGLTAENYANAKQILQKRYGSKPKLIKAHVREILKTEPVVAGKPKRLRDFISHIEVHVRALQSLGANEDTNGAFLLEIVLSRLPDSITLLWARSDINDDADVEALMEFLSNEAKALEACSLSGSAKSTTDKSNNKHDSLCNTFQTHVKQNQSYKPQSFKPESYNNQSHNNKPIFQKCHICQMQNHITQTCYQLTSLQTPEERSKFIREKQLCFNCLGPHSVKDCSSKGTCKRCQKRHHTILHFENRTEPTVSTKANTTTTTSALYANSAQQTSLLPLIKVRVSSPSGVQSVYAVLDSASDLSFVENSVLSHLNHTVVAVEHLCIKGFGGKVTEEKSSRVKVDLITDDNTLALSFHTTQSVSVVPRMVTKDRIDKLLHGRHISIESIPSDCHVSMLIGNDNFYRIVKGNNTRLSPTLVAIDTLFGWCLHGSIDPFNCHISSVISYEEENSVDLKTYFDGELCGIVDPGALYEADPSVEHHLKWTGNRYEVGFLWRPDMIWDNNYNAQALGRLNHTVSSLRRQNLLAAYHKIFTEYLSEDIIEPAPQHGEDARVRVLPHHAVVKQQGNNIKLRSVLDASAKAHNDYSLNDCLLAGENLFPNLLGVILRFRFNNIAISCDIQKAFLMLELRPEDRDSTCFYWYNDLNDISQVRPTLYRMKRLPFGVKCSPHLLTHTIQHHLSSCTDYSSVPLIFNTNITWISLFFRAFCVVCASIILHLRIELCLCTMCI